MAQDTTNKHRRDKAISRPQTADDIWAEQAYEKVAKSMADWLKGSVNLSRPISSLTRDEMTRLATSAVGTWIVLVSQRVDNLKEAPASFDRKS